MKIPISEYLSIKAASSGLLHTLLTDSPHMAWYQSPWNPDYKGDNASEADIGTYAHAMLLEGEHSGLVVVEADDWRTKAAKEQRDAARAEGKTPILARKVAAVEAMVREARDFIERTELAGIFNDGHAEETYAWHEQGVDCKIRPDYLSADRRVHLSYKTTPGSAEPNGWIRRQLPLYALAMPLYERGIRACCGSSECASVFLVQSQEPPYACSLIGLDPSWQELAERQLDTALTLWRDCLAAKRFPSYPPQIHWAAAPAWQVAEFDIREAA